jgi:integrase
MLSHVRTFGPSPRLAAFLLSLLRPASQSRYIAALQTFQTWLHSLALDFAELPEESQDFLLCDYVLDCMDREGSPQHCTDLVAAIQKQYGGRRRYRAATMTIEGWRANSPVNMADPMPEEVCYAIVAIVFAANRRTVAVVILLCFVGLLRVGEVLNLQIQDVLTPSMHHFGHCVVLVLSTSKRAAPDSTKVLLWNPRVVDFVIAYLRWRNGAPSDRFAPTSYTTVNRWISKASSALGFPTDQWRSHSMRRGGATALSLRGLSLHQVMEAGRWMSERSARLYIHKGNVALLRMKAKLTDNQWARILRLAALGDKVFELDVA